MTDQTAPVPQDAATVERVARAIHDAEDRRYTCPASAGLPLHFDAVADVRRIQARAALAATGDTDPPGMVQVGWAGTPWDQVTFIDDPDPEALDEGHVIEEDEQDGTYIVNHGDWSLRHEDSEHDLAKPWPVYGRRCDVPGEATSGDRPAEPERPGEGATS